MEKKIDLVQRLDIIWEYCAGKRVLHLGCTNSPYTRLTIDSNSLLHFELEKVACHLYGLDFDRDSLEILRSMGSQNLYFADLEHLEDLELNLKFDVIVAGEIIEHLNNPGLFLTGIQRFMNENTVLIITTINAYYGLRFFRYAFSKRGGRNEPVHPDHVAYYSYATLNVLLERHNLDVERFLFYDLGKDHRLTTAWMYRLVSDLCVRFSHQLADGVLAICKLKSDK